MSFTPYWSFARRSKLAHRSAPGRRRFQRSTGTFPGSAGAPFAALRQSGGLHHSAAHARRLYPPSPERVLWLEGYRPVPGGVARRDRRRDGRRHPILAGFPPGAGSLRKGRNSPKKENPGAERTPNRDFEKTARARRLLSSGDGRHDRGRCHRSGDCHHRRCRRRSLHEDELR